MIFDQKFFSQRFRLLTKFYIFDKKNIRFLTKFSIIGRSFDFCKKFLFLTTKISVFHKIFDFGQKISMFDKSFQSLTNIFVCFR
mgnify:CR=1 FL=1